MPAAHCLGQEGRGPGARPELLLHTGFPGLGTAHSGQRHAPSLPWGRRKGGRTRNRRQMTSCTSHGDRWEQQTQPVDKRRPPAEHPEAPGAAQPGPAAGCWRRWGRARNGTAEGVPPLFCFPLASAALPGRARQWGGRGWGVPPAASGLWRAREFPSSDGPALLRPSTGLGRTEDEKDPRGFPQLVQAPLTVQPRLHTSQSRAAHLHRPQAGQWHW